MSKRVTHIQFGPPELNVRRTMCGISVGPGNKYHIVESAPKAADVPKVENPCDACFTEFASIVHAVEHAYDEPPKATTCLACSYCGIEPADMNFVCGHPDAGTFGLYIRKEPLDHCPNFIKFEQHPGRNPDGSIKPISELLKRV